jgi:NADH-quinone oxidoreductase subunit J
METLIPTILFYMFSALVVGSGLMVISAKNPVHSVLFLIFAFFNAAGLFVLLGAEFIAMILIIVYVGAVAVLFLFVVMMLDINFAELRQGFLKYLPMGALTGGLLFVEFILVFYASLHAPAKTAVARHAIAADVTNTHAIGNVLYTWYLYPFQLAGIILLIAMIGAIVLTHRSRPGVRRQKIFKQVNRTRAESMTIVKVESGKGI